MTSQGTDTRAELLAKALARKYPASCTPYGNGKEPSAFTANLAEFVIEYCAALRAPAEREVVDAGAWEQAAILAENEAQNSNQAAHLFDGGSGELGYELACWNIADSIRAASPSPAREITDEMVERLRHTAGSLINGEVEDGAVETALLCDAADEIERLRAALTAALTRAGG